MKPVVTQPPTNFGIRTLLDQQEYVKRTDEPFQIDADYFGSATALKEDSASFEKSGGRDMSF